MKINNITHKINNTNSFGAKNKNINTHDNTLTETRYNQIAAISGLSILAGLGVALTYHVKPNHLLNKGKKLKKYESPKISIKQMYRGPNVYQNGNTSTISSDWANYINSIEYRISSHTNNYENIFKENSTTLDKLEKIAEERRIHPHIDPAA